MTLSTANPGSNVKGLQTNRPKSKKDLVCPLKKKLKKIKTHEKTHGK